MGLFQALYEIATTPVAIIKDVATLGGVLTDEDEPYTKRKMREIEESLED